MRASLPPNETERLRILQEYGIVDTGREQSFDDIAQLAAAVCQTPSSVVTFVDELRQWFKSSEGFPFRETHRDLSFCAHTILQPDVLIVPDVAEDPRFCDNPLVTGPPYIRFYAGAPIMSVEGFALGSVAVIDYAPRQLAASQIEGLRTLSRQVATQLALRRRLAEEQRLVQSAESDLDRAAEQLEEGYRRQRDVLNSLIQDERLYHGDLAAALQQVTKAAAQALNVARVSVWSYGPDRSTIECRDLYERGSGQHSAGATLSATAVPAYFEALSRMELIAADDARCDPRTREFTDSYLVPLGITSMLDARVHLNGALHGVLCHEHIGAPRQWTPLEQSFALAAANLVSLVIETGERRRAQDVLVIQGQILEAVTESLAAYVERGDWKAAFSRLLKCALIHTDSEYGFIGVVVEGPVLRVLAHEGIVWDAVINREFYDDTIRHYEEHGYLTFHNLNNLFGRAITTGEVVIANRPDGDERSSGRPTGHPPLNSFLGVPVHTGGQVTGMVALGNRLGGYGDEERRRIEVLVSQAGGICEAYRQHEAARVQDAERRAVEAALRASDERFRMVTRATNDVVWDLDLSNNVLYMPDGFEKLFGDDGDGPAPTRESWFRRVHPDDQSRVDRTLTAAIDGDAESWTGEYRFRRRDGTYADVLARGYLLRDGGGRATRMIGAITNVTARKQLEAQLRQSQKLEAVGQLAGGVAHDFNNILTVIQGHTSLLMIEDLPPAHADAVSQIAEAAERAAGLTRQLLAFSRKQVLQSADLDLNVVVGEMMRMLQRLLGEHIALRWEPSALPVFVRADASMMEQVILNLAVNARDAMPDGGRLVLRTILERLDEAAVQSDGGDSAGRFVRLSISDSGHGISSEDLPRIFEPFFTTKDVERGTGLGLATVHGVVKQHHGWVRVHSVVGKGTTFNVYLPAIDPPKQTVVDLVAARTARGGRETILVVEDEAPVRMLARLVLERYGYVVLEAEHGPAALAAFRESQGQVSLVLTDMVMPEGISGLDLAALLRAESPEVRVVVTSGYSVDLFGKELPHTAGLSFLQKPYQADQLLEAVRKSLDSR